MKRKVLLTSGGTKVQIDEVRNIGNMSRGTFGSKIALELMRLNDANLFDQLFFLHAKDSKAPFKITLDASSHMSIAEAMDYFRLRDEWARIGSVYFPYEYDSIHTYAIELRQILHFQPQLVILAAAVGDFMVTHPYSGKVSSDKALSIELTPAKKFIKEVKEISPNCKLVGFKLLVGSTDEELEAAAKKSIEVNGCDMVVANDLSEIRRNKHRVHLVFPDKDTETYETDYNDPNYLARRVAKASLELI